MPYAIDNTSLATSPNICAPAPMAFASPRATPPRQTSDAFERHRLTPSMRPSPLGPGLAGMVNSEDVTPSPPPPLEPALGTSPVRPHGVFGVRPVRRASDVQVATYSAADAEGTALGVQLAALFGHNRAQRRPLASGAIEHVRALPRLEIGHDAQTDERCYAIRFGEAFYVAVASPESEPRKTWYYIGDWPHIVPDGTP